MLNKPQLPPITRLQWVLSGLITAGVLTVISVFIWYIVALQPVNRASNQSIRYELQRGTGVSKLARQLQEQHLIRSATAFTWYVTLTGLRRGLEAGTYDLRPNDSTPTIARQLGRGKTASNTLTVPEGQTVTDIARLAAKKGISAGEFSAALQFNYTNAVLSSRPPGHTSLEGYLFPDSYELGKTPKAQALIQTMINTFEHKVQGSDVQQQFAAEGLTLHQGVTLASVVEKEVPTNQDRAIVAGIFLHRLKLGMPLQSDVTVDYAAGLLNQPFSTTLSSPYNTYIQPGLPVGPICNPSLEAMQAVAHPQITEYLYFVADKRGHTYYARTFAEHQRNVDAHLNK